MVVIFESEFMDDKSEETAVMNISLGYLENQVAGEANMCRGLFQVDSLLDISQPAYSQLQKLRGTDCANDEVSAVTQATQRPWEAKPTRVLLLQV